MARILQSKIVLAAIITCGISVSPCFDIYGQEEAAEFRITGKSERVKIPFEMINNLIVIQLSINESEPLKFILDSGVGNTLITGLPKNEQLELNNARVVSLAGLGEEEPVQAFYSTGNQINVAGVKGDSVNVVYLLEDLFGLSDFMGTYVHGLIGYDIFSNFAVEINYLEQKVILYDPDRTKKKFRHLSRHRKWDKYPIFLENKKPYIDVNYRHTKADSINEIKLLIDSGASNAFAFYEGTDEYIRIPKNNIRSLLGIGLSGNVNGFMGRVEEVIIGDHNFKRPVVAYPDSIAISKAILHSDRNGSVGGEILKRFKVIFNYPEGFIYLRKNANFKKDFSYNVSGIELHTPLPDLPVYIVSGVREGSAADKAGIKKSDILKKINNTQVEEYSLNDIMSFFERRKGSSLKLEVQRDSTRLEFRFNLRDELRIED